MEASRKKTTIENISFVTQPPAMLQVECPVCLQVLCRPHQVECCGKSFCELCIKRVKSEHKRCPTCKMKDYSIFYNKGLQQSLYQLQVFCVNIEAGCKWSGELGDLEYHLNLNQDEVTSMEKECEFSLISCKFEQIGCNVKLPRKDMEHHFESNMAEHLSLLAVSHTKLLSNLKELTDRQQQSLPCIGTPVTGFVQFTMKNYKKLKLESTSWYSPPFFTHPQGYKMCLRVDPNGNGEGRGTHLSVFVCLMRGEFDEFLKWPFRGNISLRILSQDGYDDNHHEVVVKFTENTPDTNAGRVTMDSVKGGAWGRHKFVHNNDVEMRFLSDNCLEFQVLKTELK